MNVEIIVVVEATTVNHELSLDLVSQLCASLADPYPTPEYDGNYLCQSMP